MNMDLVTMSALGLHESHIKKDIYSIHLGWRAKLFVPKKVRKQKSAKLAKDHIFQQSTYLILKISRVLEEVGFLVNINPTGALPTIKRFFLRWLKHPCDIKEAGYLTGLRLGLKAKLPHIFAEVPTAAFTTYCAEDQVEGGLYPMRTESRHVFHVLEARKFTTVKDRNDYLSAHSINNLLPAIFGFHVCTFKRIAVTDVLHNENIGILSHKNKCMQSATDGVLTTPGSIAILNERMFLFSEFGAALIGIDMFDRGNVTGDERSKFQRFFSFWFVWNGWSCRP